MNLLIVVDMQNDFITGSLGTAEAQAIVPAVAQRARDFSGTVIFTRDTHTENYLNTQEGRLLPVPHCIRGSEGWELSPMLLPLAEHCTILDKPSFGSAALGGLLLTMNEKEPIEHITLIGLCTDICIISNAMLCKTFLPEVPVTVDAACCAGVTPQSHRGALAAMKMCQIEILHE